MNHKQFIHWKHHVVQKIRELFRGIIHVALCVCVRERERGTPDQVNWSWCAWRNFSSSPPHSASWPQIKPPWLSSWCGLFQAWCWGFRVMRRNPACLFSPQMKAWSQAARFHKLDSPTGWGISRSTTFAAHWTHGEGGWARGQRERDTFHEDEMCPSKGQTSL